MRRLIPVLMLAVLAAGGCALSRASDAPIVNLADVRYREGDDARWADPAFPDSSWQTVRLFDVQGGDGVYWLRAPLTLEPKHLVPGRPLAIHFSAMATAEIHWDGVRLPGGGTVGATAAEETPGPIQLSIHVPDSLAAPGRHVVAVRLASHHRGFEPVAPFWYLLVGDYETLGAFEPVFIAIALLSLSGLLLVGLFFLTLYAVNRREEPPLWLGLLCLASACLLVAEAWRAVFGYTYDWHIVRLRVVAGLTYLINLLFLGSAFALFTRGRRGVLLGASAALLTLPLFLNHGWDPKQVGMFAIGLGGSLLWCALAAFRREPGALPATLALGGMLVFVTIWPDLFVNQWYFLLLDVVLIGLLVAQALRMRSVRRERERALVRSARLEAELLRRHIQPHFLMNTLTALGQWIEDDPHVASKLIHALADEFRALSAIADRPLVSVADEVRLCQSHVAVMALRKGCDIRLETAGLDPEAQIPPALFHTLVENAITHAPNASVVEMRLSREVAGGSVRYRFDAPGGPGAAARPEGTGLRYVRSRLEEAFGAGWTLTRSDENGTYRTEIALPERAR